MSNLQQKDVIPIEFSTTDNHGETQKNVDWETNASPIDISCRFQQMQKMSEDDVVGLLAEKLESLGG